jgi:hypothetical protein
MKAKRMAIPTHRTMAEQRRIEEQLGVPPRLRGWRLSDIEYTAGAHKASKLIAWAVSTGGPDVKPFPIARARLPTSTYFPATGKYARALPPKAKRAPLIILPIASGIEAA